MNKIIQFDGILKQQKSIWSQIKFNYFPYKLISVCLDPSTETIVKEVLNTFIVALSEYLHRYSSLVEYPVYCVG